MRIGSRVVMVGAIPIVIAAAIAVAAILLLQQANRARGGAALAGTVYRTLLTAVTARNDFLQAAASGRTTHERRFMALTAQASADLRTLRDLQPGGEQGILNAQALLDQYVGDMRKLVGVTIDNARLIEAMGARASALIGLTDRARDRQHASNTDIVHSLSEGDAKLRAARDIVDLAYATRLAAAAAEADVAAGGATPDPARRKIVFDTNRLASVATDLAARVRAHADDQADTAAAVADTVLPAVRRLAAGLSAPDPGSAGGLDTRPIDDLARWSEQTLKIYAAEYRSLHEEAAQLLTYAVQAHDTELATQNIAIETLKLSARSETALLQRDESATRTLLANSRVLSDTIASLPISPLIQSEMVEAFAQWREGLGNTTNGIAQQNALMAGMDTASASMIAAAQALDAAFSDNAERTARSVQEILLLGAATGLLLGGGAALLVARSITRPLVALQTRITRMAAEHTDGLIEDDGRRDELGDIARATNVFLIEIGRRERALRSAKERADIALDTLRRTQAELIQAEKLASLGQLVAGIAHEINTPIGIALTTATVVEEETQRFRAAMSDGRVSRSALDRMIDRVSEGAGLLGSNLTRAADLIQSFKHVAADQVSGARREFELHTFLQQLLTSLGPMLRKAGHSTGMECPAGLVLDTVPGALAQVITNLVVNASVHAFERDEPGRIAIAATLVDPRTVRLTVSDDGRGIAPEHRAKVFDPFFTTHRAQGSTGLGLQIVFNLVTATLGGRIDLHSEPGAGTRFVVTLPRVARPTLAPPSEQALSA